MYRRILVPLDGSALAETAIPHAEALATAFGSEIDLLRITTLQFIQQPDGGYIVKEDGDRADAQAYLQQWKEKLERRGIKVSHSVGSGNVADAIVHRAADTGVDLIVMSTHGRTGAKLLAYGSVAYRVLQDAPCSVLVVRSKRISDPSA